MPINPPQPISTEWGDFPSLSEAAHAAGIKPATLTRRVRRGLPLGPLSLRGQYVSSKIKKASNGKLDYKLLDHVTVSKPTMIRGLAHEDAATAADALGVTVAAISAPISKVGRVITVAGKTFATVAELSHFIGREPKTVRVSVNGGQVAHQRLIVAVVRAVIRNEKANKGVQNESNIERGRSDLESVVRRAA